MYRREGANLIGDLELEDRSPENGLVCVDEIMSTDIDMFEDAELPSVLASLNPGSLTHSLTARVRYVLTFFFSSR